MTVLIVIIGILFAWLAWGNFSEAVILLSLLLPSYLIKSTLFGIPVNLFEFLVLILFLVGLAQSNIRKRWSNRWQQIPQPAIWAAGAFLAAAIVSTAISKNLRGSLGILKGWIVIPMIFGLVASGEGQKNRSKIISALIVSGLVASLFGLLQIGQLPRIKSFYDVPNSLALFIAPLIVAAAWLGKYTKRRFFIISALVMGIALLATQALMGVVSVVVALTIGILAFTRSSRVKARQLIGMAVVVLIIAIVFFINGKIPYLFSPWQHDAATSATVRLQLWSISLQLIKEHPLLGIGLGQFEPNYQQVLHERFAAYQLSAHGGLGLLPDKPLPEFVFRDPHNFLLAFWLNTGLLGLGTFLVLNWLALRQVFFQKNDLLMQAVGLALITILLFGLADTIYWKNDLAAVWWLFILLSLATNSNLDPASE